VIGGVAGFDFVLAENLVRHGYRCTVATAAGELGARSIEPALGTHPRLDPGAIASVRRPNDAVRWARRCDLVVSLAGGLGFALRWLWPLRGIFGIPPVIAWSTGSDIGELAGQTSRKARFFRYYLRTVDLNWCNAFPYVLENVVQLRLPGVVFMDFPYDFSWMDDVGYGLADERPDRGPLMMLHASNLDWGVTDAAISRRSTKGNDRFIRAFARALRGGLDAICTILDRGPDRALARALVDELGIGARVRWKRQLPRHELYEAARRSDLVVDQFDVGGLGGTAVETMGLATPVLMYIDERAAALQYGPDLPPVVNAHSEDEIVGALAGLERRALRSLGTRARQWAIRHHHWSRCLDGFDFYARTLTGGKVAPALSQ
jgi:glycosyltransferase involved in cell wall biosynthesis